MKPSQRFRHAEQTCSYNYMHIYTASLDLTDANKCAIRSAQECHRDRARTAQLSRDRTHNPVLQRSIPGHRATLHFRAALPQKEKKRTGTISGTGIDPAAGLAQTRLFWHNTRGRLQVGRFGEIVNGS